VPVVEELKAKAKRQGLWNLFLPDSERGAGLSNLEYAPLAEMMGGWACFRSVQLLRAGYRKTWKCWNVTAALPSRRKWLKPLLEGEIRSAFIMTEPAVASSDADQHRTRIERRGDHYVINGRKWWSSGVGDPRCKIMIVMGKTDPESDKYRKHRRFSCRMDAPGVTVERMLPVFGFDDAPHGPRPGAFENVKVLVDT